MIGHVGKWFKTPNLISTKRIWETHPFVFFLLFSFLFGAASRSTRADLQGAGVHGIKGELRASVETQFVYLIDQ